jgi:trimeric autotransporter adhesin
VIASISPASTQAASLAFTLTVTGSGFSNADTIRWNGVDLSTTYVDQGTLTATVDASRVTGLGYAWVSVFAPAPGGGVSASLPFSVYQLLDLETSELIYEPFTRKIYATVPSTATKITGNSVVTIDPVTATIGSPVNVGSQPDHMALSDDGKYLFVGLDGSKSVARFNLASNAVDLAFPLGSDAYSNALSPVHLSVAPRNSNLLAISTGSWTGVGLWDISGSTATRRTNMTGPYNNEYATFADSNHVYSLDTDTTGGEFYRWTVDSNGLTAWDNTTLSGMGGFSGGFQLAKGRVFGSGGGIVNPSTTPPSMIGVLGGNGPMIADPWIGRSFFVGCPNLGVCSNNYNIAAFDQATFRPTDLLPLPSSGTVSNIIRWGRDGLAYRSSLDFWSNGTPQVYLVRGPVVAPQLGANNPVAGISSLSPNSALAGTGNVYITVNGSGFVPGAVALWNGAQRTTYLVDGSHLSVAIPASDLAVSGTAQVTVLNPGAGSASSALPFTVN